MAGAKVESLIEAYEFDGREPGLGEERQEVAIRSHGIMKDRVVLDVGGHSYTLIASDLEAAIRNATNTGRSY